MATPERLRGCIDTSRLINSIQKHARKQDLINFIEADRQFHNGILKLSGNPLLAEFADQLRSRARIYALPFIVADGFYHSVWFDHCAAYRLADEKRRFLVC